MSDQKPKKKISDFIDELVDHPDLEGQFLEHPEDVMDDKGLDGDQIEAVMNWPLKDLRELIRGEGGDEDAARAVYAFRIKMH